MNRSDSKERIVQGRGTGTGIAIGEVVLLDIQKKAVIPTAIEAGAVDTHKAKFSEARKKLIEELAYLRKEIKAARSSDIIETQQHIIKDPEIEKSVFDIIENKHLNVDFAIYQTYCQFIEQLKESGSELFRQRVVDLEDIRDRLIAHVNEDSKPMPIKKGSIIIAREISPTELVSYYESGVSGFVMEKGGVTSHAAIIANSLGIPFIVSAKKALSEAAACKKVIVDADVGEVILNPSKVRIKKYQNKVKQQKKVAKVNGKETIFETKDGFPFRLLANIEFEAELPKVKSSSAQGVGLLRTESLLFGKPQRKSEEEQVNFYNNILDNVIGPVTIRLFDVGGDKTDFRKVNEANPFLGWRGVRLLLDDTDLLRSQLKAILKVAGNHPGRIKILVPMASVLEEVKRIRKEIENIQASLLSAGEAIDERVPIGLMVEVPSVALSAFQFAREVDFFSLGTNDLTQYTMAADRGNELISSLYQHYHPSVLRLIKLTVEGAEKADIDVFVCGELAGDEIGAACLFGLGVKELSMTAGSIPKIKNLLGSHTKREFQQLAEKAIEAATSEEVQLIYNNWING